MYLVMAKYYHQSEKSQFFIRRLRAKSAANVFEVFTSLVQGGLKSGNVAHKKGEYMQNPPKKGKRRPAKVRWEQPAVLMVRAAAWQEGRGG